MSWGSSNADVGDAKVGTRNQRRMNQMIRSLKLELGCHLQFQPHAVVDFIVLKCDVIFVHSVPLLDL
jgi:hypothetical protein